VPQTSAQQLYVAPVAKITQFLTVIEAQQLSNRLVRLHLNGRCRGVTGRGDSYSIGTPKIAERRSIVCHGDCTAGARTTRAGWSYRVMMLVSQAWAAPTNRAFCTLRRR
jgi:hypothetical protein